MARSLLDDRSVIPPFSLEGRGGRIFDVADYKRKRNIVLFFLTRPSRDFLVRAEEAAPSVREQNAEMIVVVPWSKEAIEAFHKDHRLTFALLSDSDGKVLGRFISAQPGGSVAALFVTDRYGE